MRSLAAVVQRAASVHSANDDSDHDSDAATSSDCDSTDSASDEGGAVPDPEHMSLFDLWSTSRPLSFEPKDPLPATPLPPGSRRRVSLENLATASRILYATFADMLALLWGLNPLRTAFMICLTILRGFLPAFRGYSQALILDEIQKLISSGDFPSKHLVQLLIREGFRMFAESLFDAFANDNESRVHASVRFLMEHRQLEQRLRLDIPTLADPSIRDLLHESDLFVRSFNGLGFGFGLFSPFDLIRILSSIAELASQLYLLYSTSRGSFPHLSSGDASSGKQSHSFPSQLSLLGVLVLPTFISLMSSWLPSLDNSLSSNNSSYFAVSDQRYTVSDARISERAERMRSMAHGEPFRAEVLLFGLAPWILDSWATARKRILGLEVEHPLGVVVKSNTVIGSLVLSIRWLLTQTNASEMIVLLQNLPFLLYTSSTSLGSLALYRTSLQSLVFTMRSLMTSFECAFQSIFFMGAFFAAMTVEPLLTPPADEKIDYESVDGGMKIEARNISFTYPGSSKRTLNDVSFSVEAGEMLAIVGYNGSGKSTLANVLLRIFDYDSNPESELLINGRPLRFLDPTEYHSHVTALFQVFSKLNATVRENVGIGDVRKKFSDRAVRAAAARAGASRLVDTLPRGLDTNLESMGLAFPVGGNGGMMIGEGGSFGIGLDEKQEEQGSNVRQGLSGGEWQRVAISRALMRARSADLLLLDEPTSHLDAHAQNAVLESIDALRRDAKTGRKMKTVIVITHQLSIARRADKIAMFENGTITEFGTHEELLSRPESHYGAMYRATCN